MSERAILKIMQASTCFGKDVCPSTPCACAAALAAAQRAGKHKCNAYASVEQRAWEFVRDGFKSFNLSDDRLRVYAGIIAELIQGAIDDDRAAADRVAGEDRWNEAIEAAAKCAEYNPAPGIWTKSIARSIRALALSPGKVSEEL